jgi:hypothetical protein
MRRAGSMLVYAGDQNFVNTFSWKPCIEDIIWKAGSKFEDNIKMDLKNRGWNVFNWLRT